MVVYCRSGRCRDAIPYGRRPSPIGVPSGLFQGRPYIHALVPIWPLESIYARRPGTAVPVRVLATRAGRISSKHHGRRGYPGRLRSSGKHDGSSLCRHGREGGRRATGRHSPEPHGAAPTTGRGQKESIDTRYYPAIASATDAATNQSSAGAGRAQELACVASQTILIRVGADRAESLRFREDRKKEEDAFALQFFQEVTGGAGEKGGCSGSQSPPVAPKVFFPTG